MKRSSKIIIYICASFVLFILVWWVGSSAYSGWMGYKSEKKTEEFQLALSKPYREDTYGGKTPEETWGMFLDALKKGDVELASKYFVPEKQEEWLSIFEQTVKEKGSIEIDKLESIKFDSKSGDTMYYYRLIRENGKLVNSSIIFILNPYTKVWKISLL